MVPNRRETHQLAVVGAALPLHEGDEVGQLFCFLPLPLQKESPTGSRVHINGSFAVTQNRYGHYGE